MEDEELFRLPERPFFSCDDDGFSIVDGALMRNNTLTMSLIEPVLKLKVGPGNLFEQRPSKFLNREGDLVDIECEDGSIVHLDFRELAARVERPDGVEYIYRGPIDEGNEGLGFIAAR